MRGIRTLIVDDEPLALSRLRRLLSTDADIKLVAECVDAFEAVEAIHKWAPDLIFLDIQMPERDGFSVLEEVGIDRMPHTVFVTAFDEHALRAFEVNALDYLLKPYNEERFLRTLGRAKELISNVQAAEIRANIINAVEHIRQKSSYLERILIKTPGRMFFISLDKVHWIKSEGNYLRINLAESSYLIRDTVSNFQAHIDPKRFLRIHRSTIVNLEMVKEMVEKTHGDYKVLLYDGTELTFSRHYRVNLSRFESRFP